jgi:hypothetical protein
MTRGASNTGLTREFPKDIKTMGVSAPQELVKGECTGGVWRVRTSGFPMCEGPLRGGVYQNPQAGRYPAVSKGKG